MTTPEQSLDVIDKGMAPLQVVRRWTAGSRSTTSGGGQIGRMYLTTRSSTIPYLQWYIGNNFTYYG
jgi:hypothetical protein